MTTQTPAAWHQRMMVTAHPSAQGVLRKPRQGAHSFGTLSERTVHQASPSLKSKSSGQNELVADVPVMLGVIAEVAEASV